MLGTTIAAVLAVSACSADGPDATGTSSSSDGSSTPAEADTGTTASSTRPGPSNPSGTTTTAGTQPLGFAGASLQFFGDCPALAEHMRDVAGARVTPWGLEGDHYYGGPFPVEEAMDDAAVDVEATVAASSDGDASAEPNFSGTNVQEVGVDEGDVVETDGEYIYVADHSGVRIVRVDDAEIAATIETPGGGHELLLDGARLTVVTRSWDGSADTIVSVYDVSDPSSPELVTREHLEGALLASRAIDGTVRLVLSTSFGQRLPFVTPGQFGYDEERALERNREIVATSAVEEWLPRRFGEIADGSYGPMESALDCRLVGAPDTFSGLGVTWIATFDIDGAEPPVGSAGVVSSGSTVYASPDSIYVANQYWDPGPIILDDVAVAQEAPEQSGPPPTVIHQFDLHDGGSDDRTATYVASGAVEGRLLNQFSMSEQGGDLRVATTVDDWNQGDSESFVTVLRPNDGELEEISSIGGLGRGEQIYAVRFMGDVGYVVTFRQIDPLYVLDLSDPANPILEGELKIPGYSSYLHPVGDGLLLGVGQDADELGQPLGTQLSLFDVSEPTDPQRIDTLMVGGWSDVEWDHRAFLYWPEDGTIAIPATPGWGDCGPNADCLADGLTGGAGTVVAELDGRELIGRGTIDASTTSGCWNPPMRTIAIDDELAAVSPHQVTFADRSSLDIRDTATWAPAEDYGCYFWID